MHREVEDAELWKKLKEIDARPAGFIDAGEVTAVVEAVISSLSGDLSIADLKFYSELEELARYIQSAKREIREIRPHDISATHIPMATDELDAVVNATADATGAILDVAETIEKLVPTMPRETGQLVSAAVTRVYEACNFQDITGQRITKVVTALKHIEAKVAALLAAFGEADAMPMAAPATPAKSAGGDELMSGPQLPVSANRQAEIDAILAEFDKT
jgi:chemotaxis protein CheZ